MTSAFSITPASNSITFEKQQRLKSVTYTVTNDSGQEVRGRASLATVPDKAPHLAWLSIDGESERPFIIGATEQYKVNINVPADAAPDNYTIRLNMVATHNPDETFSAGPTVTLVVPEAKVEPKKFPIWIIPVIVLVLVGIAAAVFFATRSKDVAVPDVVGLSEEAAGTEIASVGLQIGRIRDEHSEQPVDAIARTDPSAGTEVPKNARVDIFLSRGTDVPTDTPTPTLTPTATPDLAGTAAVQATQTAVAARATASFQATATSVAATATADAMLQAAANKYTGTWVNDTDTGFLTRLEISRNGTRMSLRLFGTVYSSNNNGLLSSRFCGIFGLTTECEWGAGEFTYNGDPMAVSLPANGLTHDLTLTITPDGTTLSIVDQVKLNGTTQFTDSYVLKPKFNIIILTRIFVPREFENLPFQPAFPLPTTPP